MRIEAAGGFVNAQGRVNGNLNLSRAIGDQQYKQDPALPPWAQVISAEPDMVVEGLTEEDRFMILACDGVRLAPRRYQGRQTACLCSSLRRQVAHKTLRRFGTCFQISKRSILSGSGCPTRPPPARSYRPSVSR